MGVHKPHHLWVGHVLIEYYRFFLDRQINQLFEFTLRSSTTELSLSSDSFHAHYLILYSIYSFYSSINNEHIFLLVYLFNFIVSIFKSMIFLFIRSRLKYIIRIFSTMQCAATCHDHFACMSRDGRHPLHEAISHTCQHPAPNCITSPHPPLTHVCPRLVIHVAPADLYIPRIVRRLLLVSSEHIPKKRNGSLRPRREDRRGREWSIRGTSTATQSARTSTATRCR